MVAAVAVLGAAAVAAVVLSWRHGLQHWLAVRTGTINEPGPEYGFWSGFGSDIGEVAIVGGLISVYRRNNCEVHGCWLLGRHQTAAGHHVCRRHHPDDHLTGAQALEHHARAADPRVSAGSRSQPGFMGLDAESGPVPPAAASEGGQL